MQLEDGLVLVLEPWYVGNSRGGKDGKMNCKCFWAHSKTCFLVQEGYMTREAIHDKR